VPGSPGVPTGTELAGIGSGRPTEAFNGFIGIGLCAPIRWLSDTRGSGPVGVGWRSTRTRSSGLGRFTANRRTGKPRALSAGGNGRSSAPHLDRDAATDPESSTDP